MIDDDRKWASQLVGRLSLEDKALLLTGKTAWRTWALPSIGLREMVLSDGPVGVRGTGETPGETSDCLPSPTALSACWDEDLAARVGRWFAWQARAHGVDVVLAPVVNLQRSPVGGRHFECLSEDPNLTADIAVALIRGMQQLGVGACVKHFVGNEVETDRTSYVSRIDELTLREVYLAPFERVVAAGVWSVMAAYNRTDAGGEAATMVAHRHLLVDVLKGEWGFAGPVVSDWTAVTDTVPPALGGLDLAMPGPSSPWSDGALVDAVRRGDVPESLLDDKVARLLWLASKVGALEGVADGSAAAPATPELQGDPDLPRLLAARACVVLTNRDDALPLGNPRSVRSVALIGPNAVDTRLLGGGSGSVAIDQPVSLAEGLQQAFPSASITVCQGVSSRVTPPVLDMTRTVAPGADCAGVLVEFLDANGGVVASQVRREWTGTFGDDVPDATATIHLTTSVRLDEPGCHWLGVGTVGRHRIEIDGQVVSESPHDVGGEILINSSFNVPPAHGAPVTVTAPRLVPVEAWVQLIDTQWGPRARAALHHRLPGPSEDESIAQACRVARDADLAVVVVGTNEETESEGWDRKDLGLPGRQNDLVGAVLGARPDAVILVNAGAPVLLPWLDRARTVVWCWLPGQAAGLALGDVLTGVTEPAGRLPWTLPDAHEHCPVPYGLPNADGVIEYTDGVDVGYRGWARSGWRPARPFGFGLGWTSWQLDDVQVVRRDDDAVRLGVRVANTGQRAGADVVQAYLMPPAGPASASRPAVWLAGHARVQVGAGQSAQVVIEIPRRAFEVWQPAGDGCPGGWTLPPGAYVVAVGQNASDLGQRIEVAWA